MSVPRAAVLQLAVLPSGRALIVGGQPVSGGPLLASAETYDLTTQTWMPAGSLKIARGLHTTTTLANGKVLVTGGGVDTGRTARSSSTKQPVGNAAEKAAGRR